MLLTVVKVILSIIFILIAIVCAIVSEACWSEKGWKSKLTSLVCLALCILFILAAFKLGTPFWVLDTLFGSHGLFG